MKGGESMETKEVMEVAKVTDDRGIIRSIDELHRVVIPIQIVQKMGLKEKDKVKVDTEGDKITLQKVEE